MEKRRNSPIFYNIFNISLTSGVKLHIQLLNLVVRFIVFLTSAALIFRGTDISMCFRGSLGIRDNESRLYMNLWTYKVENNGINFSLSFFCSFDTETITPGSGRLCFLIVAVLLRAKRVHTCIVE